MLNLKGTGLKGRPAEHGGRWRAPTALLLLSLTACAALEVSGEGAARQRLGTLDPKTILFPGTGALRPEAVELGRRLFFDTRLSLDGTLSCASCHRPEAGFSDGKPLAVGLKGKTLQRHTPSLFNIGLGTRFFWDGRANSLEEQARMVIENPDEMGMTVAKVVDRLRTDEPLGRAFEQTYPGRGLGEDTLVSALVSFEQSLLAFNSPFDRHMRGESGALGPAPERGMALFLGKAGCVVCHRGPNFSDGEFHNTGVPTDDLGRVLVVRNIKFSMRPYPFFGNRKAFKTPTLRNARLSPPYFHNGTEKTLEDVVDFYNRGGRSRDPEATSPDVHPLGLTPAEAADLVAFLDALTSPPSPDK